MPMPLLHKTTHLVHVLAPLPVALVSSVVWSLRALGDTTDPYMARA